MPIAPTRLLIAEDDPCVRESLEHFAAGIGYRVRAAENGFEALAEIQVEVPDILLSDLNMPRLSGFELLAVVNRRFPTIHAVAMSGAYCGEAIPQGVIADAFYEKGSSMEALMRALEAPRTRTRTGEWRSQGQPASEADRRPTNGGPGWKTYAAIQRPQE